MTQVPTHRYSVLPYRPFASDFGGGGCAKTVVDKGGYDGAEAVQARVVGLCSLELLC